MFIWAFLFTTDMKCVHAFAFEDYEDWELCYVYKKEPISSN